MTFAGEAWPFVAAPAVLALALLATRHPAWATVAAVAALATLLFFRIPRRPLGARPEAVLAPANGKVTRIDQVEDEELGPGRHRRIVTFLSVFNVHVQRAPVAGTVVTSRYRDGRKVAAFRADAADVNENHLTVLRRPNGDRVGVRQVAGLLARRVVAWTAAGQDVEQGELIGLIKFGSRVDLYLPESYEILVREGESVSEGRTPVAVSPREGTP